MLAKLSFFLTAPLLVLSCSGDPKPDEAAQGGAASGSGGAPSPAAGVAGNGGGGASGANVGASANAAGIGGGTEAQALIVPDGLNVVAHAGGCGVLKLFALTLRRGATSTELYAALRNDGETSACSPAFSIEMIDKSEQSVATSLGGLLVRRFYRLADESGNIAACVAPGDVSMVAITDLPAELVINDLDRVEYWCNFWALSGAPLDGIAISDVQPVTRSNGVAYTGVLVNRFDASLTTPSVAVFALNAVGRPLGVALSRSALDVPAGGRWDFETDAVSEAGVDQAAYPMGGP